MLKNAIEYLVGLKPNKTYEFHGDIYSDKQLNRIAPHIDRPNSITVGSLVGIVKLAKHELDLVANYPLFIHVESPTEVRAFSSLDAEEMGRDFFYKAQSSDAGYRAGWKSHEETLIELRSRFIPTEDSEYLLDILSRLCVENGISSNDNGVTQTVTATQGVSLKENVPLKPIVKLCPFRIFREVPQPTSEFLLRVDDKGNIGLFEADGGIWKIEAKENIAKYISEAVEEEIQSGKVVVMI